MELAKEPGKVSRAYKMLAKPAKGSGWRSQLEWLAEGKPAKGSGWRSQLEWLAEGIEAAASAGSRRFTAKAAGWRCKILANRTAPGIAGIV